MAGRVAATRPPPARAPPAAALAAPAALGPTLTQPRRDTSIATPSWAGSAPRGCDPGTTQATDKGPSAEVRHPRIWTFLIRLGTGPSFGSDRQWGHANEA